MLEELRCEKLITKKLEFKPGLNVLIGPDDGTNSIGKSSVLMLIDFALSGDDFVKLSSDVIRNVGDITVEVDFVFDGVKKHSFSRSTNDPKIVNFLSLSDAPERSLEEYRGFLKTHYNIPEDSTSFRGAVNPFFRIWGKDNYNPSRPLNSFPDEPYSKIKPNLLKLFSFYGAVKSLEKEKAETEKKKNILKGAFDQGYIKTLTQREKGKNEKRLHELEVEIKKIKQSIELHSINANQIVNDENIQLKSEKDELLGDLFTLKNRLSRIDDNLTYGSTVNKKYFEKLKEYFPEVNSEKLVKVDQFHSGITKILKSEIRDEKGILEEKIGLLEQEVSVIDERLVKSLGMLESPAGFVDKVLELSFEEKGLRDQNRFRDIKLTVDTRVSELSEKISEKLVQSLSDIQKTLNSEMSKYINLFYEGNPVAPEIKLSEAKYDFFHNDDSGTGKSYANMIAMDMSFLETTYLPILIHDLIVFSNIEDHAIEEVFKEYAKSKKQVFVAIDKLRRFKKETKKLAKDNEFLCLDSKKLAFGKSWKERS